MVHSGMDKNLQSAFSLVELSIVLVILGLLTGGVLTGQSLIRASELRSVTTEYTKYVSAVQAFRDKYFALPGDMTNATSFWGAAHATPATCLTTVGTGTQTCNGNGDGNLWYGLAAQRGEPFAFWVHLANAGLVEGSYSGFAGAGGIGESTAGTNVPKAKMSNAGWGTQTSANYAGDTAAYAYDYGNALFFGAAVPTGSYQGAVLRPEEAWNIDTKLDDGKPAQGRVVARFWNNLCAAADDGTHANNDLVASYKLTDATPQCALFFVKAF